MLTSCFDRSKSNDDVIILLEDFYAQKDSVLNLKLINNSKNNYYITLDTTRTYNYGSFNSKLNNSVVLKLFVYGNGEPVPVKGERFVSKTVKEGKNKCIDQEITQSDNFYKNYITLQNAVFLKSESSKVLTIPFSLKFKTCFAANHYDLIKGDRNEIKVEYRMQKEILEKYVPVKTRDSLENRGYIPNYQLIVSNRADIFL